MAVSVRRFSLLGLLTGSLVLGCSNATPTSPVANDVAAARVLWQRAALTRYAFTSTLSCFCAPDYSAAMRVVVLNGLVSSITAAATGVSVPVTYRQPIDSIFVNLARQAAENPSMLTVQFDATLGYPVYAEFRSLAADAGYTVDISNLQPLP